MTIQLITFFFYCLLMGQDDSQTVPSLQVLALNALRPESIQDEFDKDIIKNYFEQHPGHKNSLMFTNQLRNNVKIKLYKDEQIHLTHSWFRSFLYKNENIRIKKSLWDVLYPFLLASPALVPSAALGVMLLEATNKEISTPASLGFCLTLFFIIFGHDLIKEYCSTKDVPICFSIETNNNKWNNNSLYFNHFMNNFNHNAWLYKDNKSNVHALYYNQRYFVPSGVAYYPTNLDIDTECIFALSYPTQGMDFIMHKSRGDNVVRILPVGKFENERLNKVYDNVNACCFAANCPVWAIENTKSTANNRHISIVSINKEEKLTFQLDEKNLIGLSNNGSLIMYFRDNTLNLKPFLNINKYAKYKRSDGESGEYYTNIPLYVFPSSKSIKFNSQNPHFSKTVFCKDNSFIGVTKVVSKNSISNSATTEYIWFDFIQSKWGYLTPDQIAKFNNKQELCTLESIIEGAASTPFNVQDYTFQERYNLEKTLRKNFYDLAKIHNENLNNLITFEPRLTKQHHPIPQATNNN